MAKIITNPTSEDVSIIFQGVDYTVGPKQTIEVTDAVATFWTSAHQFLKVSDSKTPVEVIETIEEIEEVEESVKKTKTKK